MVGSASQQERRVVVLDDHELDEDLLATALDLCLAAFPGNFSPEDWEHTFGGERVLVLDGDVLVGHLAVVPRRIRVAARWYDAGYVEGVAVLPERQGQGHGAALLRAAGPIIATRYEIGFLATNRYGFYGKYGWQCWEGSTLVYADGLARRTPEHDADIMVLTGLHPDPVDLRADLTCLARSGADW